MRDEEMCVPRDVRRVLPRRPASDGRDPRLRCARDDDDGDDDDEGESARVSCECVRARTGATRCGVSERRQHNWHMSIQLERPRASESGRRRGTRTSVEARYVRARDRMRCVNHL